LLVARDEAGHHDALCRQFIHCRADLFERQSQSRGDVRVELFAVKLYVLKDRFQGDTLLNEGGCRQAWRSSVGDPQELRQEADRAREQRFAID
jgi:hypothetical protein